MTINFDLPEVIKITINKKQQSKEQPFKEQPSIYYYSRIETFATRLAPAKLASGNDIAVFVKKTYFDDKLIILNKKNCLK